MFKECSSAVDGTHIPAVVSADQTIPYRTGRKYECTRIVVGICSFDMHSYVYGHDGRARLSTFAYLQGNNETEHQLLSPTVSIMLSILAIRTRRDILLHTEIAGIICRTTGIEVGLVP